MTVARRTLLRLAAAASTRVSAPGATMASPVDSAVDVETAWHSIPDGESVLKELGSSQEGLSSADAAARLAQYGPNALTPPKKKTFLQRLWEQVNT